MNTDQKHIPVGHPNRPGIKLEALRAIVIHYTGNSAKGATDIANIGYMGRPYWKDAEGKKFEADKVTPFAFGSAHVFIDEDSITEAIPLGEVSYSCGDRPLPWDAIWKGQKKLARLAFNNRQNFQTVAVEICNNGDWAKAVTNAVDWCRDFLLARQLKAVHSPEQYAGLKPGEVLLVRHHDITGKVCPRPFVEDPKAWDAFKVRVMAS